MKDIMYWVPALALLPFFILGWTLGCIYKTTCSGFEAAVDWGERL